MSLLVGHESNFQAGGGCLPLLPLAVPKGGGKSSKEKCQALESDSLEYALFCRLDLGSIQIFILRDYKIKV